MCDDGSSCPSPKYGPSLPSSCELQLVEPNIVMADAVRVFDLMAKGGDSSIECFLYMCYRCRDSRQNPVQLRRQSKSAHRDWLETERT